MMSEPSTVGGVFRRFRKYFLVSLMISIVLVPVFDSVILQRDRNRNMVYGKLFWQEGLSVYEISDQELNTTYGVPDNHLLTGVLNVTYEYPIMSLLFYAFVAALEPDMYGVHWLANWLLVVVAHLNLILFLFLGRAHWDKRWFRQFFALFYAFGFMFSVGFAKTEPLADLLWLGALVFYQRGRHWEANGLLGLAVQTKLYPGIAFPFLLAASPIASTAFILVIGVTSIPFLLSGIGYGTLTAHLLNSSEYSSMITNPSFLGLVTMNPLSILPPLILVLTFLYCTLNTRKIGRVSIPWTGLRTSDWKTVLVFAMPLTLMLFSWVLIWYYSWFVIPFFLLKREEEMKRYRWMIVAIWVAHFLGILLSFEYFFNGPIAEFIGHLRG